MKSQTCSILTIKASRAAMFCGGTALTLIAGPVVAETGAKVRVSASANVDTNPFLSTVDPGATVGATISVEPSIYTFDERSEFSIDGALRFTEYEGNVRSNESASIGAGGTTRLSKRTALSAGADFRTSRNSAQDILRFGGVDILELDPDEVPEITFVDPTSAGGDRRQTSISGQASVSHQLTELSNLNVGVSASQSRIEDDFGDDFRRVGAFLGYSRALSERTSLTASVSTSKADFLDQESGDSFTVTPLIGISQRVSERLTWSAGFGITYSEIEDGLGGTIDNTAFAANASLCNAGENSRLCFSLARDARPTNFSGLTTSTSAVLSLGHKLSERDTVSVGASYRRSDRITDQTLGFGGDAEYYGVNAGYRRQLGRNFSAFVDAGYTKVSSDNSDRDGNLRGAVGISYTFGGRR